MIEVAGISQAEVSTATALAEPNLAAMLDDKRGIGQNSRVQLATDFGVQPVRFVVNGRQERPEFRKPPPDEDA